MQVRMVSVGQGLSIVIFFLFEETERGEDSVAVVDGGDVVDASTGDGGEAEVLYDKGQCARAVAPVGIVDGGEGVVMVAASF